MPPGHPIVLLESNYGRRIGKKVYCCNYSIEFNLHIFGLTRMLMSDDVSKDSPFNTTSKLT